MQHQKKSSCQLSCCGVMTHMFKNYLCGLVSIRKKLLIQNCINNCLRATWRRDPVKPETTTAYEVTSEEPCLCCSVWVSLLKYAVLIIFFLFGKKTQPKQEVDSLDFLFLFIHSSPLQSEWDYWWLSAHWCLEIDCCSVSGGWSSRSRSKGFHCSI